MTSLPAPPWTGNGRQLESSVRKAIHQFQLLDGVSRLGIALSGGKDSISMLLFLKAISGHGVPPLEIACFHVGGAQSCGANVGKNFLAQACQQLEVPLFAADFPQTEKPLDCYPCSRIRRKLIFDMAKKEGYTTLAFGHHRDDNAQTLLMNLLHKGEFAGLLPKITLFKYGVTIIRPLIFVAEDDIKTFAKQNGFLRCTCQCPAGQTSLRKKADLLLTSLSTYYPHARLNLSRASLLYGSTKAQDLPSELYSSDIPKSSSSR